MTGICGSIRVGLSQVEFLDLSQTNDFENICQGLFSLIKNESYGIEDDRSMCGSNVSGLVTCFVGLCHLQKHFLAVASAKVDLLVTMHLMLCVLRLTTIPKCQAPWTRRTVMKALRAGSCAYDCKAQTSARMDVPTAPMTLKYTIEHADDGSGMCKAGFARDDALCVIFPSIVGGYNMPGIMFGMDPKDNNSSDEVQIKRCDVTAVAGDASCLFGDRAHHRRILNVDGRSELE